MLSQTQSLTGDFLGNAANFKHHLLILNNSYPAFGSAFTGTHTGAQALLGVRLVGENLDPDLTTTLGVTGHGNTGGFDLVTGDPAGLQSLDTELTVGNLVAAGGSALHAASLHAAILGSFRH